MAQIIKAITNSNGFYYFPNIKTCVHKLTITADGFATQIIKVKIVRGKTIMCNVNLKVVLLNLTKEEVAY